MIFDEGWGVATYPRRSHYVVRGIWTQQYTQSGVWGGVLPTPDSIWDCTPQDQDTTWDCTPQDQDATWTEVDTD